MDESHETFLSRLNLSQYLDNFREAGFDDLETVVTLSEEEIEKHVGIVLPGHKPKLVLNFEKLRQPAKAASTSTQPQKENSRRTLQTKLTFQSGSLSVVLPPEPADPDVPWKQFPIPHPRFPQQKFFNSFLPQTYESAYPHLLTRFEAYWIKERWERKEVLDNLSVSVTRMMDMSDKNYMARVRTLPNPSRPQDATTCISAIKEIDSKLNQLACTKRKDSFNRQVSH